MGSWKAVNYKMPCLDAPFHMTIEYFLGGPSRLKKWMHNICCIGCASLPTLKRFSISFCHAPLVFMMCWDKWCLDVFGELSSECYRNAQIISTYGEIGEMWPEQMWGMVCKIRENEWMVDGSGWLMDLTSSDKVETFEPQLVSEVKKGNATEIPRSYST